MAMTALCTEGGGFLPRPRSEACQSNVLACRTLQVGDFHRTMLYGGIYGYPADAKNKTGKLRLLYECAPMSMIAEQVSFSPDYE